LQKNKTWLRLKKNKGALIGIVIIFMFTLVAIFAYVIAPDNASNANSQIVEIGRKKPGATQLFYVQQNGGTATSFGTKLLDGVANANTLIPIHSYTIQGDSLLLQKYIDQKTANVADSFWAKKVMVPFNKNKPISDYITNRKFILGTDNFGRDIFSRIIIGTRVSLSVGLIAVLISLTIGIILGALAGYYKGWVDEVIMWFINVIWSIPTLLLVFAFTIAMGKGFWQVFIAVGLTMWVNVARLVRGQVLKEREMQYVEAGKVLGFSNLRIIFKHILPNIFGPIIVIAASNFASAIIIEAGLSFMGIGVQAPKPSWGLMIKENYNFIITNNPMLALAPGFAIMILVLAFYLLGNGLRDALNVKGK
jgi:ABC-type dipeptide/oligopeptide/nickel transport system permease subunit